jgi:hypothetical protein
MKPVKPFKHIKVVKVDLEREFYTKHGQHLKNMGKRKVSVKIAEVEPNSLYWKTDQEDKGSQTPIEEKTFLQDLEATALDKEVVTPIVEIHGESAEEVKGRSDSWTKSGSLENLGNPTTKKSIKKVEKNQ